MSHRLLLLRSVKDDVHPTRVDVLFLDVAHVELPTAFPGLVIRHGHSGRDQLTGDGWHGEVRAAEVLHAEDDGEYYDAGPFEHAFLPRPR